MLGPNAKQITYLMRHGQRSSLCSIKGGSYLISEKLKFIFSFKKYNFDFEQIV